jgi:hypothetical protein
VFLLWTAVDLTNPELCALDNDPLAPVSTSATLFAVDDAGLPDGPAPHIDDCFCCSRCVEASPVQAPAGLRLVTRRAPLVSDTLLVADHASVYHPPQVLS